MSHRWRITWGRRLVDDAPEPIAQASTDNTSPTPEATYQNSRDSTLSSKRTATGPYRNFIVYSKEEDAVRAMHLRKDAAKDLPAPLVTRLRERHE
jgi:hypothetical protein